MRQDRGDPRAKSGLNERVRKETKKIMATSQEKRLDEPYRPSTSPQNKRQPQKCVANKDQAYHRAN